MCLNDTSYIGIFHESTKKCVGVGLLVLDIDNIDNIDRNVSTPVCTAVAGTPKEP